MSQIYLTDKGELAYYEKKATPQFWDQHWEIEDLRKHILSCTSDGLFLPFVKKYLPQGSRILEGGCGRGNLVNALQCQGYKAIGVDFAQQTVAKANDAVPELDIREADVRNLPFKTNNFDGYISAGVIEHFWNGYDKILLEMKRVIKPGGFLFLSFPYMSPIRKLKSKIKIYESKSTIELQDETERFYQFALDKDNVIKDLRLAGFVPVQTKSFDGIKGFKDELTLFKLILQPIYDGKILNRIRPFLDVLLKPFASHCVLLVLKNE